MQCLKILNFRRILVPDTSPCLFHKFLGYLYSGTLDKRTLSTDDVPEMLALSDKYEVWWPTDLVIWRDHTCQ